MARRCEDFPCCGHEQGCCPDFDASGKQLNMICTCGKELPIDNGSSICDDCLDDLEAVDEIFEDGDEYYDHSLAQQELEDFERSDEYYGYYGGDQE